MTFYSFERPLLFFSGAKGEKKADKSKIQALYTKVERKVQITSVNPITNKNKVRMAYKARLEDN